MSSWLRRVGAWAFRIVVVLLILYGLFILAWSLPGRSPSNTRLHFSRDIRESELEDAYEWLCKADQERLSLGEFVQSEGAEYAVVADAGFGAEQYPEGPPAGVSTAWTEVETSRPSDGEPVDVWRLHQVYEWFNWRICGIEHVREAQ